MSITKNTSGKNEGKYRVRIQSTDSETGKTMSIPIRVTQTASRSEAKTLEQKMWVDYRKRQNLADDVLNQPLTKALNNYVEEEYNSRRWSSITTYNNWKYTVKLVSQYFGKKKIRNVKEKDIRDFARSYVRIHQTTVTPHSTIAKQLQNLRCFFFSLQDSGLIKNPVPIKALSKFFRRDEWVLPAKKYVFSNSEIKQIKAEIYQQLKNTSVFYWTSKVAILIAFETGMRPQEIQGLKWSDITDENKYDVFRIDDSWNEKEHRFNGHLKSRPKGEYRLTLPLTEPLVQILQKFRCLQDEFLFEHDLTNENSLLMLNIKDYRLCTLGYPIVQRSMNDMLKKVCDKLEIDSEGLNISMYTCRHTVATKLGNTPGMSYPWAASRMGHTVKMFMKTYVHVDEDRNTEMSELIMDKKIL